MWLKILHSYFSHILYIHPVCVILRFVTCKNSALPRLVGSVYFTRRFSQEIAFTTTYSLSCISKDQAFDDLALVWCCAIKCITA